MKSKLFFYITCFMTGAIILILEILGFRIFAPYFGTSVYVTGTLIGLVLGALSLGYYFGGKIADTYLHHTMLYYIILGSAVYLIPIFVFYQNILGFFSSWGVLLGTVMSTAVIFVVPMVLLSMVSPYLIKLTAHSKTLGVDAGKIFAFSTIGSLVGSFSSTFYLIPQLGSRMTFTICIVGLLILALCGLFRTSNKYLIFLFIAMAVFAPHHEPVREGLLYAEESMYSLVQVYDMYGARSLVFENPRWRQSYLPDLTKVGLSPIYQTYREFFALAPYLTLVNSAAVLGMSAGASVHELRYFYPEMRIHAVDIDPTVVKVAKEYFDIVEDDQLTVFVDDARNFLADDKRGIRSSPPMRVYDFIEIDLFGAGTHIPFYTVTSEFFGLVRESLTRDGIMMMNVLGTIDGVDTLLVPITNTIATQFESVFLIPFRSNTVVLAMKRDIGKDELVSLLSGVTNEQLLPFSQHAMTYAQLYTPQGRIFTDDNAPVAQLTYQFLKEFE